MAGQYPNKQTNAKNNKNKKSSKVQTQAEKCERLLNLIWNKYYDKWCMGGLFSDVQCEADPERDPRAEGEIVDPAAKEPAQ